MSSLQERILLTCVILAISLFYVPYDKIGSNFTAVFGLLLGFVSYTASLGSYVISGGGILHLRCFLGCLMGMMMDQLDVLPLLSP
jgi:hypothetical protein